ncbi:MAG: hypothetical protein EBY26_00300 [Microbacteriaceae bacterium]|nr:hypothetical protein [Microbacteriaceae bacterium]
MFREPESVVEFTELDDMGQEVNEGATAQNAFKAPKLFRCKFCEVVVSEYHLEEHYCVEGEEANGDSAS